eukprot:GHRQ01013505.1.p3 GENE.GHRQ01013505.1~~GHRQ01013505.1.p3  ORF type:complete len:107 (-),score=31.60 GHRQ01013505.1:71-391(-)
MCFVLCCSAAEKPYIASMGIYVMTANTLKELLENHMPDANDFGNEVIPEARKMGYPVQVSGGCGKLGRGYVRNSGLVPVGNKQLSFGTVFGAATNANLTRWAGAST